MLLTLVGGFGVVVAVNFYMASQAASSFGGVTVENSYIASQRFNRWLEEARAQEALGWEARIARGPDGHAIVQTSGVPEGAEITAELRRPIGQQEIVTLSFAPDTELRYSSTTAVEGGRWIARLAIASGADRWEREMPIE